MKIVHVITGLERGGAELTLFNLLANTPRGTNTITVISLAPLGPLAPEIAALGVEVESANMPPGRFSLWRWLWLVRRLRELRPHIVQSWMYHADLLGGWAAKFAKVPHILWNVRSGSLDRKKMKRSTLWTVTFCAWSAAYIPEVIITCALSAKDIHVALGYPESKFFIIPNGVDTKRFSPDPGARMRLRHELGLSTSSHLVGMVARFDPQKDHHTFLEAAGFGAKLARDLYFVLVGKGLDLNNKSIGAWIVEEGIGDRVKLLGLRNNISEIIAALDVSTLSSSYGEGFPNVVAESMSCGVPCVVTDVGDAAFLVDNESLVVPPGKPEELSDAWLRVLNLSKEARREISTQLRSRTVQEFSIPRMVDSYNKFYGRLSEGAHFSAADD